MHYPYFVFQHQSDLELLLVLYWAMCFVSYIDCRSYLQGLNLQACLRLGWDLLQLKE